MSKGLHESQLEEKRSLGEGKIINQRSRIRPSAEEKKIMRGPNGTGRNQSEETNPGIPKGNMEPKALVSRFENTGSQGGTHVNRTRKCPKRVGLPEAFHSPEKGRETY